jgi:hypothetical protein
VSKIGEALLKPIEMDTADTIADSMSTTVMGRYSECGHDHKAERVYFGGNHVGFHCSNYPCESATPALSTALPLRHCGSAKRTNRVVASPPHVCKPY